MSNVFVFLKGFRFTLAGVPYAVVDRTDNRLLIEDLDGNRENKSEAELASLLDTGELLPVERNPTEAPRAITERKLRAALLASTSGEPDPRLDEHVRWLRAIIDIEREGITHLFGRAERRKIAAILTKHALTRRRYRAGRTINEPMHPLTVQRHMKFAYTPGADMLRLKPGPRGPSTDEMYFDYAERAIAEFPGCKIEEQYRQFKSLVEHARASGVQFKKDKTPSYRWFANVHADQNSKESDQAAYGPDYVHHHFRHSPRSPQCSKILGLVYMDATQLNIVVREDPDLTAFFGRKDALVLGQPWIILLIDVFSWMPLGFYLGFEPPSAKVAGWAITHAIRPKTYIEKFKEEWKIVNAWPAYGIPFVIALDQALEHYANAIQIAIADLHITIQRNVRKSPWQKHLVEALHKAMKELFRGVPGNTIRRPDGTIEPIPPADRLWTLRDLAIFIHRWLIDVWAQRDRKRLKGRRPDQIWCEAEPKTRVRLPHDRTRFELAFFNHARRRLTGMGVEINEQHYNNLKLKQILYRHGSCWVDVRWSERNVEFIYVLDPDSYEPIKVLLRDEEMQRACKGLSLYRYKALTEHIPSNSGQGSELQPWERNDVALRRDIMSKRDKRKTHKQFGRQQGVGTQSLSDEEPNLDSTTGVDNCATEVAQSAPTARHTIQTERRSGSRVKPLPRGKWSFDDISASSKRD